VNSHLIAQPSQNNSYTFWNSEMISIAKPVNVSTYPSGTYRILLEHDNMIAAGQHLVILR